MTQLLLGANSKVRNVEIEGGLQPTDSIQLNGPRIQLDHILVRGITANTSIQDLLGSDIRCHRFDMSLGGDFLTLHIAEGREVYLEGVSRFDLKANLEASLEDGVRLTDCEDGTADVRVWNASFSSDLTFDGVAVIDSRRIALDGLVRTGSVTPAQRYGVSIDNTSEDIDVRLDLTDSGQTGPYLDNGIATRWHGATRGTATIGTGLTSVTVTHGFAAAPATVEATPLTDPGATFWVDTIGASTFDINIGSAAGGDIDFAWVARP